MDARTVFAWVLVAVLSAVAWLLVQPFLAWLLATGLLAFLVYPVHRRLADRVGSKPSAGLFAVLVTLLVVGPLAVGVNAVLTDGVALLETLSETGRLRRTGRLLERYTGLSLPVQSLARRGVDRLTDYLGGSASQVLSASLHAFIGLLLLIFVFYYLLKDGESFVRWLKRATPLAPDVRDELFAAVYDMTWAVLKGHVLVAFVQGVVAGVALFLTGVPHAFLLTASMTVLALVPVVGVSPVLGGAVVFLFLAGRPLAAGFVVVWGFTAVAVTDDYLRALLIDRESRMHSAVIFVGIAGGTYLLGAMGIFVGPILLGLFKTTVDVLAEQYDVTPSG